MESFDDFLSEDGLENQENKILTTKKAIELLLEGKLDEKVCKFCLKLSLTLHDMEEVFSIGGQKLTYNVSIKDMLGTIYPFQIGRDPNLPNCVCDTCLNRILSSYFFAQQLEQSMRALDNCIEDIYEKMEKLDPIDPPKKKRGRQKLNPNTNIINVAHNNVIDYAEPLMCLVGYPAEDRQFNKNGINPLECPKCWEEFPSVDLLLNHETKHLRSMWYNCKLCGMSFTKKRLYTRHVKEQHVHGMLDDEKKSDLICKCSCGHVTKNYGFHLQHLAKHKFKSAIENIIHGKTDRLCVVCLGKDKAMVKLNSSISLHGGYPEINGKRSLYHILMEALPKITNSGSPTGTKMCEGCMDRVIATYLLTKETDCLQSRLVMCLEQMTKNIKQVVHGTQKSVFLEIEPSLIMPSLDIDFDDSQDDDDDEMNIEVLEDEFRIEESESEEEEVIGKGNSVRIEVIEDNSDVDSYSGLNKKAVKKYKGAKKANDRSLIFNNKNLKTYSRNINGVKPKMENMGNCCDEFLIFHDKAKPEGKTTRQVKCFICNKTFISNYFLKKHVKYHINNLQECSQCGLKLKSKFFLMEHSKLAHTIDTPFKVLCAICGRTFKSETKLKNHKQIHLNKNCSVCKKQFKSRFYFENHMRRHIMKINTNKHIFKTCSFCEKSLNSANALSLHVNKYHLQIKPYSCEMCDKQFYTIKHLVNHKKIHSLPSREECSFCDKVLKSRLHFIVHLRKHIGTKPYKCVVCNEEFYCNGKKITHMKEIHGGKFVCKVCMVVFINKNELKSHVECLHN